MRSSFTIRSSLNNRCLDITGFNPNNGAKIIMWDCHGAANQRWHWEGATLRSDLNNRCLDIAAFNPNNGAEVIMWDCHGAANQRWYEQ